jgi:hypothetical protein
LIVIYSYLEENNNLIRLNNNHMPDFMLNIDDIKDFINDEENRKQIVMSELTPPAANAYLSIIFGDNDNVGVDNFLQNLHAKLYDALFPSEEKLQIFRYIKTGFARQILSVDGLSDKLTVKILIEHFDCVININNIINDVIKFKPPGIYKDQETYFIEILSEWATSQNQVLLKKMLYFGTSTYCPDKLDIEWKVDMPPDRLPDAHTCFNYINMPIYPTKKIMKKKLEWTLAGADNTLEDPVLDNAPNDEDNDYWNNDNASNDENNDNVRRALTFDNAPDNTQSASRFNNVRRALTFDNAPDNAQRALRFNNAPDNASNNDANLGWGYDDAQGGNSKYNFKQKYIKYKIKYMNLKNKKN